MYNFLVGFSCVVRNLESGYFCLSMSAVFLFTKEAGLPVSIVALTNEASDLIVTLTDLVLHVAVFITSRLLTSWIFRNGYSGSLSESIKLVESSYSSYTLPTRDY